MKGLEQFLNVFGNITVFHVVEFVIAVAFILYVWKIVKTYINNQHDAEQKRDAELKEALDGVRAYPTYRAESITIRNNLEHKITSLEQNVDNKIDCIQDSLNVIMSKLNEIEEKRGETERKKLQSELLQYYRLFTNVSKNPKKQWSEMEADSFWQIFELYEAYGGNGYMHSVVQPAMMELSVIPMDDEDALYELMHSRNL